MKRGIAIILTALLLLNTVGYFGILLGLQYNNSVRLQRAFDMDSYDETKAVVVRLPLSVPYSSETPFQRVDGTFEFKGEFYKLVKQRFVSDTLEVFLMKDDRHKEIQGDLVRCHDQSTSHGSIVKTLDLVKDYLLQRTDLLTYSEGWEMMLVRTPVVMNTLVSYYPLESPPPKSVG